MPKLFVERAIHIDAPKESVKDVLNDYHRWRPWSPWLIAEPEARMEVAGDGNMYSWEGRRVGAGRMQKAGHEEGAINMDLTFLKPWKSTSRIRFEWEERAGKTRLTWKMEGALPFFMFFMKKQTEAFIGMDFDRGLTMLKQYVEEGRVSSHLEFLGPLSFEGTRYIGIRRKTSFAQMPSFMQADFEALLAHFEGSGRANDVFFSQYHKFRFVEEEVEYTAALGVSEHTDDLPPAWVRGEMPPVSLYTVRHIGRYHYLGNAWSTAQMLIRAREFRPKKDIHPLEFYRNDPRTTSPDDLITDVCFAV